MPGSKLFRNDSPYNMQVTLVIRASENPNNEAGTKEFTLTPKQSSQQDYGDNINIYLNGITLTAAFNGQMLGQQYIIITRGSDLDNSLNMHNGVDFGFANNTFTLTTRQVS